MIFKSFGKDFSVTRFIVKIKSSHGKMELYTVAERRQLFYCALVMTVDGFAIGATNRTAAFLLFAFNVYGDQAVTFLPPIQSKKNQPCQKQCFWKA
jgi:hypothetical protein